MTDDDWPTPAPPPPAEADAEPTRMSRKERFTEVLRLEGLAAAAKARANTLRDALEEEACTEYNRDGTAPTWRMEGLGTATLPVSHEAVVVADPDALLRWCKTRRPDQVRIVEEVYASYQDWLTANCVPAGDVAALPDTAEVVPGLAVRPAGRPGTLSFRPASSVRQQYQRIGERWLDGER